MEDDPTYLRALVERLGRILGLDLVTAKSRDTAQALLEVGPYDLIVCDLKIPTNDGELDLESQHGEYVIALARERYPGTPIVILSAFGTLTFVRDTVAAAPRRDVIGDQVEEVMVDYLGKDEIDRCVDRVEHFAARLGATDGIEIRAAADLSAAEARVIRIFARGLEGQIVQFNRIRGGFSNTSTLRISVRSRDGQITGRALAKVGPLTVVNDEASRFQRFVSPMLPPGSCANLQKQIQAGAGAMGGLFYQLAEDAPSLFSILEQNPEQAAAIVDALSVNMRGWLAGAAMVEVLVRDVRITAGVTDLSNMGPQSEGLPLEAIEKQQVFVYRVVQHGDLHGGNVLVYQGNRPVVIDYGEVGQMIAGYDPVVLELSLLFHPSGEPARGGWPSEAQVLHWEDLERYVQNCPVPQFVRACRRWADAASPSDRGVVACAYAYAVRQLKYGDTNKGLVRGLVSCAGRFLAGEG